MLAAGTRLMEFELREVVGAGGFGIVYLAFDHELEREVAIKEYMPASLVGRTETLHVSLRSESDAETFSAGLKSFVKEARLLAKFDHPSLLKVLRYWEANGTAYMAMPVLRGQTLKALRLAHPETFDETWLRRLLAPLLDALDTLHQAGVYHRDIAPDNIQIEADGHPVLMDFGAARRVLSDKSQNLTAVLKPAYAPIEQYGESGSVRQGPWTDFYALGATVHFLLLGRPPSPATARMLSDDQVPLAEQSLPGCSAVFLQAIDWMMAPRPADRPQSVAQLREVLDKRMPPPVDMDRTVLMPTPPAVPREPAQPAPPSPPPPPPPPQPQPQTLFTPPSASAAKRAGVSPGLLAAGALVLLLLVAGVWWLLQPKPAAVVQPPATAVTPTIAPASAPASAAVAPPAVAGDAAASVPAAASAPATLPAPASPTAPAAGPAAVEPRQPSATPPLVGRVPPTSGPNVIPSNGNLQAPGRKSGEGRNPADNRPADPSPQIVAPPPAPQPSAAAPGKPPAVEAAKAPEGPADICNARKNSPFCMSEVCRRRFKDHPDCVKLRADVPGNDLIK